MKTKLLNLRIFFLVFLTALILYSCKKDETAYVPAAAPDFMLGYWAPQRISFTDIMVGTQTLSEYVVALFGYPPLITYRARGHSQAKYIYSVKCNSVTGLVMGAVESACTGTLQIKPDSTYTSDMEGPLIQGHGA